MTFYLFRHGETYFSKNQVPYGVHELTAEILPEAKPAIKRLSKFLEKQKIEAAFRSEFLRCKQTAEIIEGETSIVFLPEPLLSEFTETDLSVFVKRTEKFVKKLSLLEVKNIAICTHGANVAVLRKLLADKEFRPHDLMYYPKTGVIVKIHNNKEEEISFRD